MGGSELKKHILFAVALAVAIATPASAQMVAPMPVTDVLAEPVWLKQLVQDVAMGVSLHQSVEIAIQNVVPTQFRWALNTSNPSQLEPILETSVAQLDAYNAQIQTYTGAAPLPNEALQVARAGMTQLPGDEADLQNAQAASDACEGDLCAQQASHRFQQLQVTAAYEQRQFEEAKYIEEQKDEAAAMAWMTTPSPVETAMEQ
jgi:hypothetical protein